MWSVIPKLPPAAIQVAIVAVAVGWSCYGCAGATTHSKREQSVKQYELAVGLQAEGNFSGAFKTLFRAIELDPDNAAAHHLLGSLFLMKRDENPSRHDALSEKHFRESVRVEGEKDQPSKTMLADAYNGLGVLRIHQGRHDEAIELLREAVDVDLFNTRAYMAWGNLGWALQEKGQHDEARDALARAVKLNPGFCVGHYRLGKGYLDTEQFQDAEQFLTRAIEADERCGSFQDAWHLRGVARMNLGYRDDARADFERCVELAVATEAGRACSRYLEATY